MAARRKLAFLVVEGDRSYEQTHNVFPVTWQAFYVIEIFMHFWPKLDLDGSSKLFIFFREKPDSEQQNQYMQSDFFGVSKYYVDEAEIDRQRRLTKEEKGEYYLNIIADTLKRIAQIHGGDAKVFNAIDETAQKVRDNNFELTLPIKKLSKASANGQFRANVYRHISNQGESWYVEIKTKNKDTSCHNVDLSKRPTFISQTGVFEQSKWEGNCFIVTDKSGRITATIDAALQVKTAMEVDENKSEGTDL